MRTESPGQVDVLEPLRVRACLDEFRDMRDGWFEGQGVAPPHNGLDWLADCFERNYPGDLHPPHVYPTFDGGIQAEWSFPSREIDLEVNLITHQADWYNLDLRSENDEIISLNLDDTDAWAWLVGEIRRASAESDE